MNETDAGQGRLFRMVRGMESRGLTARRAAGIITVFTLILTVICGIAIWLLDRDNFPNLGEGLWWAVQTLTTVGYGDVVPTSAAGKVIATVVMLNGIAFLTVITAAVTAMLIEQARQRRARKTAEGSDDGDGVAPALEEIRARLESIEATLDDERRERRG